MYYLYKKSKSVALPSFAYTFAKFEDFYKQAKVLTMSLVDTYFIRIRSDSYKDVMAFVDKAGEYTNLTIYVETTDPVIDYILLRRPQANMLTSKSNYDTFCELISEYRILFDKGCLKILYTAIEHDYVSMKESLELIKQEYPDKTMITEKEISSLFVVDKLVYPRSVCIMYIRMDRWRRSSLEKCIGYFGNDLVLYSIRKNVRYFLEEKIKYLRTGRGTYTIKSMPVMNIVRLYNAIMCGRKSFMDITTILNLYEKGVLINDTLQERTVSLTDAECNVTG